MAELTPADVEVGIIEPSVAQPSELERGDRGLSDDQALDLAMTIAQAAEDRKASDIKILDVSGVSYLADYFVIASGFSNVQVRAIARTIEAAVKEKYQRSSLRSEGTAEGRWVLQDYGEVIVHIFMPKERDFYDLEAFWGHAQTVPFEPDAVTLAS